MSMRADAVFLSHMLAELTFLSRHCHGRSYDAFLQDEVLQRAVARSLEILGEAAKNLSADLREQHPHVEWQRIAGLRDVLIHRYFGVDWEIVWGVLHDRLPLLEAQLRDIATHLEDR